jgi:hypothetical protein
MAAASSNSSHAHLELELRLRAHAARLAHDPVRDLGVVLVQQLGGLDEHGALLDRVRLAPCTLRFGGDLDSTGNVVGSGDDDLGQRLPGRLVEHGQRLTASVGPPAAVELSGPAIVQ